MQDEVAEGVKIDGDAISGTGSITAKDVTIDALGGDQIVSFSIAGTKTSGKKDTGKGKSDAGSGSVPNNAEGGTFGFGASGDVSINNVENNTRAYVDGQVLITTTGKIDLFAANTGTPQMTGSPELIFADAGTNDTITRNEGSWIGDGFRAGQTLRVKDTNSNDGYYRILSVEDIIITLETGDNLTSQTTSEATITTGPAMSGTPELTFSKELNDVDTIERDGGSWVAEGFRPGQIINISGTTLNNGEFKVVSVTASTLSIAIVTLSDLSLSHVLKNETIASGSDVRILAADDGLAGSILAGSGSVVLQGNKKSAGLAGSYSQNTISGGVQAFVSQATLNADGDINISARTPGSISSYAASGNKVGKLGIAGQVTNNEVSRHTKSFLEGATILNVSDVRVSGIDTASIFSVSGVATLGGEVGIGASVSINQINSGVKSYIDNADLTVKGDVKVDAISKPTVDVLALGGAISGAASEKSASTIALGGAFTFNDIATTVEASIKGNSKVTTLNTGSVILTASDESQITAEAIGFSGALTFADGNNGGGLAIGAAIARNQINNNLQAYILDSTVESDGDLQLSSINKAKIIAEATAVAVALTAANQTGISLSGGGAESTNVIIPKINAYIEGSMITSGGDVDIQAMDTSSINADVLAAAITATLGLKNAGGVAIGASFSTNLIGWEASFGEALGPVANKNNDAAKAEVQAYIKNSKVEATRDLYLTALANGTIEAGVDAVAVGLAGGAGNAGQLSGAGVRTENRIRNQIKSFIDGTVPNGKSDQGIITADSANLIANDTSKITANALSAAVAASFGADNALGGTIGVSLALNEVLNEVEAYIKKETVTVERAVVDQANYKEKILPGVTIVASGDKRYQFLGRKDGDLLLPDKVDLSAENYGDIIRWEDVTDKTTEFDVTYQKTASEATKKGRIKIEAKEDATISATVTAASIAVAGSGKISIALSGGGAEAVNIIGTNTNAYIIDSTVTSEGEVTLDARNTSLIDADVLAVSGSVGIGGKGGVAAAIGASIAHNFIGFDLIGFNADGTVQIGNDASPNKAQIQAYVEDSTVKATTGDIRQTAISHQTITAEVWAGSVAISGGSQGALSLSGAGVSTVNKIATQVKTYIDGAVGSRIEASNILLTAQDTSKITAKSGAAALAVAIAPKSPGVSVAIGVALAENTIANTVESYITNSPTVIASDQLSLTAKEAATVEATTIAASLGVAISALGVGLTGAGANATNIINNKVHAYIDNSNSVIAQNNILIDAQSEATITSLVGAASVAGGTVGAGAIGVSLARNLIGLDGIGDTSPLGNEVLAYVKNSTLTSDQGNITVQAKATDKVDAVSFAGSVAIAGGILAAAGAGAEVINQLSTKVEAYSENSNITATVGDISVTALSNSEIVKAQAIGVAVAVNLNISSGVAISVGVSKVDNDIKNQVQAYVIGTTDKQVKAEGNISINADAEQAKITDSSAFTASVSGGAFGLSGGGVDIDNVISNTVKAWISGSLKVNATQNVEVIANENANAIAESIGISASFSIGAAVGASIVENTISSNIEASIINGATVDSVDTTVKAISVANIEKTYSLVVAGSAVGVASNDASATVNTTVSAFVKDSTLNATGNVLVEAHSTSTANSEGNGVAVGAVGVGVVNSYSYDFGSTTAYIENSNITQADNLDVLATAIETLDSTLTSASGGVLGGVQVNKSESISRHNATAYIGTNSKIDVDNTLNVIAKIQPQVKANADGYSVAGGIAVGSSTAIAETDSDVNAYINIGNRNSTYQVKAANLNVEAKQELPTTGFSVEADAMGSGGGLLASVNGSEATAKNSNNFSAYIGDNTNLNITNVATITVQDISHQDAYATGVSVSGLSAGFHLAKAETNTTHNSYLGTNVIFRGGTLNVTAFGNTTNFAESVAGGGGIISGQAADARTINNNNATVTINNGQDNNHINVTNLNLKAQQISDFNAKTNAINASIAGGSGADSNNIVTTNVLVDIKDVHIIADNIVARSHNIMNKSALADQNAEAGSGGVFDASAVKSITRVRNTSKVTVADNATLEVVGDLDNPGDFVLNAHNKITARDEVNIDVGGGIPFAGGDSIIGITLNQAIVEIGNADLKSVGDIDLWTRSDVDIATDVQAKTYGLAGLPSGTSITEFTGAVNQVLIKDGAFIYAKRDVNIDAGRGYDEAKRRNYSTVNLFSNIYLLNGSAGANPDPVTRLTVNSSNLVTIEKNATIQSVRDVAIEASKGFTNVSGKGEGKSLWKEIASWFGGSDTIIGNPKISETYNEYVTINGSVTAGFDNKQRVRLDQINATSARVYLNGEDKGIINSSGLKIAYDDNSSFEILDVNFASDIINRIKTIESILATYTTAETNTGGTVTTQDGEAEASTNYRGSTFTAAEKQNYEDELAGLEFLQNSLGLSLNDPAQTFISLPNIVVSSGDIIINTQNLSGSGDLTAQGDSLIEVENNSNINLLINTLIIRDGNGGKLLLNGQSKTSNGEILAANSSKSGVNFTNISTSEGETTEISVINKSVNGPLMLSNDDGIVSNLDGIVSLVNDKGSIGIQGELAAKTINIQAGEDFILTDGYFFHTGGNPESVDSTLVGKYESLANPLNTATTTAKDRIPSLNPYFQINSQGYNGRVSPNYSYGFDPSPATTSTKNLSHTWETATTNPSAIVAENNIFISANYINVNGLIQSGVDSYNLILESSLNDDIEKEDNKWGVDAIDNDYRYTLKDGMTTNGKVTSGTIGAIKAVFNPFTNLIEVEDIDVRGGYVELRGKVLSTGTGRIQAMDGFGNINITNYTDYGLELGNLNAGGEGIEGQIVIIDRLKNTESRYTYSDAGNLLNNNAVVSSGRSTLYTPSSATYKYVSYGNEYTYDYNEAYTSNAFTWRTGLPTTPSMKYTYTVGLKIVGEDDSNRTGDKDYSYILENSNLGSDYEFDATANVNSISYVSWYYPNGYKNDQPNLLRDVVVTDFAIQEYFTHSFKANHPIDIRFVGNNTGAIKVTSNQSIYLNGSITNVAGTTTLNSKFGSILMPSDSIIDTKNIVLSAETGIGELDQALATGIRGGTINATTTSGNIDINDEGSGLKVQEIQASNGDVTLITKNDVTALNGNSLIAGNLVTLNSASGTIGTASSAIQVDTKGDTSHGLDAQANNGIYLTEKTGDLFLIQATSQNGDVSIRATNGSIVDNNTGGEEDLIAKDEVLAAINQKLRLTVENGALESIKETKEAYKNSKQQDYQRYWEYRNIQDNRNISYVDDNTATVLNDFGKLVPVNSNGINFSLTDFTNYFGDVDGDALASITIKSLPSSGLLQLNGVEVGQNTVIDASDLGNLVYIPGEDFTGDVEFEVLADDGSGNTDLGSITLRVGESNTAPIFSDISVDGLVNKKVEFEAIHFLSGFSDGDGDRLAGITVNRLSAVTINALPTNGTLMLNGQAVVAGQRIVQFSNLEFIPSNGFTGIASFGVTVEDEFGATALGQVNVNIKAAFTADAYDPNFQYQFDQSRKDNLSAMGYSEAKIQGLEQQKTQDYHALHGQLEAPGLTAAYDPNYKYEFSSNAEENSLEEGGVWTKEQLKYGLSSAIFLDVSDTELVIEDPNAKGHNITLRASVNIGSDNGTRSFLIADITKGTPQEEEFLLAIATAERSDITYYADVAGTIVITGNVLEYNDVPARIDIRIREDVDIEATGVITASSNGVMFLGSEENMNLNTLNSNNNDVRIKSAKGIYNGVGGSTVNVIAGNEVILEAGDNDIGTKDSDVRIQVGGNNVFTARSGNNIYLTQVNNDIKLDNLFAVGHIRLKAEVGSILDRFETETRNIRSASLELIAAQSIGTANNFFDIIVDGQVDATANDGIYLRSLSNLTIGTVTSNNSDVRVQLDAAAQNIDILNSINAAGNVTLEGENTLSLGANGEINAGVNVFILARDITLGTVKAASGEVFIEAKDSLELAADSNIFANGNITMKIDSDPLDDPGVGGTTNIYGNVTSNGIVEIEGGVDDDIFTFNGIITAGAATISSFEGEDEFYFQGINTPLTVYAGSGDDYAEINAPDSANGILIFNAGAGNDTIDASQAALALVLNGEDDDDTITGGMGDDLIGGGDGDDTIDGKEGADKIFGDSTFEKSLGNSFTATNTGSGEDNLQGGDGADLIKGEGENDRIFGGDGNDDIAGGLGDDTLGGDAGNDLIKGEEGNDIISGGDDDDVLEGGLGDDTLRGDAGNDLIKGEEGNDTVTYDNSPNSVVVNLDRNQGFANLGGFLHESVFLHHQFVESDLEPTFAINAGEGQDGFGGIDTLIDLENAIGSDYADVLIGDDGDNKLFGLKGNDVFISNVGNDSLEGNEGRDAISYRRDPNAVIVDLSSPTATDGFGDTDSLTNIEDLIGTAFDDTLTGDSGANRIYGGDGQDIISGGDGNDELYGENDNDELYGDSGDDFLVGGLGVGNTITDQIDGGEGIDTVSYYTSTTRVSANLGNGTGTEGDALGDRFTSVENLEGSEYNDTLRGDDGANILSGLGGDDKLYGLDGDNSIYGGDGNDFMHSTGGNTIMDGGSGINTFTVTGNGNSIIYGGEGNDNINTGAGDDVIYGGEGINVINAGEGNNTIYGGSGKDTITSGSGNDTIYGGEGDNVIRAGEGNNTVTTGSGNDNITSGAGDDIIDGGDGNNFINAGTGNNTVTTGAGNDNITSSTGDDIINAGDGDNFINAGDGLNQITGGTGKDTIHTGTGDDIIDGGDGDNFINAGTGNNTVTTGSGKDTITTGSGDDIINAGNGDNFINAGDGLNQITTGAGNDNITTGSGDDIINAGNGKNYIYAGNGDNDITTGTGDDRITSGTGNDVIVAGDGYNFINAGDGDNDITGGDGIDYIIAGAGNDIIRAGEGNNIIRAGEGNNTITAGSGRDNIIAGSGNDTIDGGDGDNTINAGNGNNEVTTGSGNDRITTGSGDDFIYYGDGIDLVNAGTGINDTKKFK
ncbi:Bifunctional hemolysin/adenylate cyclase (plasmid) [Dolichospermum sp. UHCC 0315A]|uniref:Ig-like domain-containing protein n=1 Tax=Dolichospermum sp. UHCC 0315A TaxID=1914871 RepID=UPI0011E61B4B|nr:Ig-like domain-containing protein [Dolichospermum sp. UHCC 0315A]QEI44253.1 Bifunctional hemolysin/adenylate cyclase [Dolichospermum sp. UHCC 0315A]QEI44399.1 Bifunctional hemolysin/adenylate cyclase [Dolichospermum sp. UHCC 0315A]